MRQNVAEWRAVLQGSSQSTCHATNTGPKGNGCLLTSCLRCQHTEATSQERLWQLAIILRKRTGCRFQIRLQVREDGSLCHHGELLALVWKPSAYNLTYSRPEPGLEPGFLVVAVMGTITVQLISTHFTSIVQMAMVLGTLGSPDITGPQLPSSLLAMLKGADGSCSSAASRGPKVPHTWCR